jgi:uncharacterized protein (TIGR00251 family)
MIDLRHNPEGTILPVKAQSGARRSAICGAHNGMLKVNVTTAPEKGKANRTIVEMLCEELSLSRSQITLVAGQTARNKQFLIRDLDAAELSLRIAAALAR